MKKIAALLLSMLLLLSACPAVADTALTAKPGDELTMEVSITSAGGLSAKIGIHTNSAPVTFVRAVGGSANDTVPPRAFNDFFAVVNLNGVNISSDGASISSGDFTVEALADGVIGTLTFRVNDDAEPGLYVVEAYKASGSVTVNGALTFRVEDKQTTDRVPGDANGDGDINSRDALLVLRYSVGEEVSMIRDNADVTGDGEINSRDALMILRYSVGDDVVLK